MIEKLTPEQEAQLPVYADKWIAIGRDTRPTNRAKATEALNWMYVQAGLPEPLIIFTNSPHESSIAKAAMEALEKMEKARNCTEQDLTASQWKEVYATFQEKIAPVIAPEGNVWQRMEELFKNNPSFSELVKLAKECVNVDEVIENSIYGQHEAHWLAFYEYFHDVCDLVEETKELHGLWMLARNAGWILPYEGICFVAERHNELHFDDNDRLHNENGASILFPDGFGTYHWRGVRVPDKVILTPDQLIRDDFISETNAEVRRAILSKTDNAILEALDMTLIDKSDNPEIGELYEFEFIQGEKIKVMKLQNSTAEPDGTFKNYWIYPRPEVTTIEQAHSSIAREVDFPTIQKLQWA